MKILFQNGAFSSWGGAGHQISILAEELRKKGHETTFDNDADPSKFDAVHLSHINLNDSVRYWDKYSNTNAQIVVKCIWHTYEQRVNNSRVTQFCRKARFLVVESQTEKQAVVAFLKSELDSAELTRIDKKFVVMRPGVLPLFRNTTPYHTRQFVHTNGWYSFQKCQADVIKACKSLNLPVVTAGRISQDRGAHLEYCRSFGYGTIFEGVDKDKLNDIYNQSRVYVVSSLFESHSTSMCEAIACGCKIVSSSHHVANGEYNGPGFYIYKWGDFDDLKAKIRAAYESQDATHLPYSTTSEIADKYHKLWAGGAMIFQ